MTKINILTRTGNRETYFKTLKQSIENQTYKNIRHLKSNDNINCKYLDEENDVINVKKNIKLGNAFYNLYLNELGNNVNNGWIIILDDDSKLIDNTFLEKLADECSKSTPKEILIFQSLLLPKKVIIPSKENFDSKKIERYGIDMACFCFHHSILKQFSFDGRKMGDLNFLEKIKKNKNFEFKFISLPIGVWGNYDGAKNGKN